jgi:phosphatidyl-myo-inositol alpha-mannosyltransferase
MLKVGIVTEYYYPLLGGISEHVHNTALQLTRLGHEAHVITSNPKRGEAASWPDAGAFPIHRIGRAMPIPFNGSVTNVTVGFKNLWDGLRTLFFAEKYDVVHVHSPIVPTLPPLAILASPCRSLATYHSYFDYSPIYKALAGTLQKHFLDKLDGQIAVSQSCVRALEPYFRVAPRIIPNGIDVDRFSTAAPRIERFDDGRLNLLFLSRFEPRNGLDLMLDAFALVRKQVQNVRLIVVGDGDQREQYEQRVAREFGDAVHMAGPVLTERPSYYVTADIYCAPISKASFGMTLLEAMACGRPIVATENDGYRDLLGPDEGLLVPPHDAAVFAEAILKLLADGPLRKRMGEAGRAKALEYAWPSVTRRLISYYDEVLSRP